MAQIVLRTPAVLFKDEDGSYVCGALPLRAFSSGGTAREARKMAEQAVLALLEFWKERGILADALRKHGFSSQQEQAGRLYEFVREEISLSQSLFASVRRSVRFVELTVKLRYKTAPVARAG